MASGPSVSFLWKIENFNQFTQLPGEKLESPLFYVNTVCASAWELHLYPNSFLDDEEVKVFLHNNFYDSNNVLFADYEISFLSANGSVLISGKAENVKIDAKASYQIGTYPTREEVLLKRVDDFLPHNTLTVRCRIWKSRKILSSFIEYSARTRIEVQRRVLHWAVGEFTKLKPNEGCRSYQFTMGKSQPTFSMEVGLIGTSQLHVDIKIKQINKNIQRLFTGCKLSVLDERRNEVMVMKDTFWFSSENSVWKYPRFLTKNGILTKRCFVGGTLNLLFDFNFSTGEEYSRIEGISSINPWLHKSTDNYLGTANQSQSSSMDRVQHHAHDQNSSKDQNKSKSLNILELDLDSLYKDRSLSDFELRSKEKSFAVHRMVLADKSPVFKAMFSIGMEEGGCNFLNIPDVDGDTLKRLLQFVYTGKVEISESSIVFNLYHAADKYEVLPLKQKCSVFLRANMAVTNACEILVLADRHQDGDLKSAVHAFMMANDEKIIRSDEWKRFMKRDSQLASETMYQMYSKKLDILNWK